MAEDAADLGDTDAARLRLARVYALRPRWRHWVPPPLAGIGE